MSRIIFAVCLLAVAISIFVYRGYRAESWYEAALLSLEQNSNQVALKQLDKVISYQPFHSDAYIARGKIFFEEQRYYEALINLYSAEKLSPNNANIQTNLAKVFVAISDYSQALHHGQLAIEYDQTNAQSYLLLAEISKHLDQQEGALDYLDKAILYQPTSSEAQLSKAKVFTDLGDTSSAIENYQRLIELEPNNPKPYVDLAKVYLASDRENEALENLKLASKAGSKDPYTYHSQGVIYLSRGLTDIAEKAFIQSLELDATAFPDSYLQLAKLSLASNLLDAAKNNFEQYVNAVPKDSNAWVELGKIAQLQKDTKQAEIYFDKALELNPKDVFAASELSLIFAAKDQWKKALSYIEVAVFHSPEQRFVVLQGLILVKLEQYKKAQDILSKINLRSVSEYIGEINYNLALIHYQQKDFNTAQVFSQKAIKHFSTNSDAQILAFALSALIDIKTGQTATALLSINEAKRIEPNALFLPYLELSLASASKDNNAIVEHYRQIEKTSAALQNYKDPFNPSMIFLSSTLDLIATIQSFDKADVVGEVSVDSIIQATLDRGFEKAGKGEYAAAESDFTEVIRREITSGIAFYSRGNVRKSLNKWAGSITDFRQSIQLDFQVPDSYRNLGDIYSQQGNTAQAIKAYSKTLELQKNSISVLIKRADIYLSIGKNNLALLDYTKARESGYNDINAQLALRMVNLSIDNNLALPSNLLFTLLSEVIQANPNLAFAYYQRGLIYYGTGRLKLASNDFNQAVEKGFSNLDINFKLGLIQLQRNLPEQALTSFNQALAIEPTHMQSLEQSLSVALKLGLDDLVLQRTETLDSLGVVSTESLVTRANIAFKRGNIEQSLQDFNRAIELSTNPFDIIAKRSIMLASAGRLQEAIEGWSSILLATPERFDLLENRALAYAELSLTDKAIEDLLRLASARKLTPSQSKLLMSQYMIIGDIDNAQKLLQDMIITEPSVENFNSLINLTLSIGDYVEARRLIKQGIANFPQESSFWLRSASLHTIQHEYQQAQTLYTRYLQINPGDAFALFNRGKILLRAGSAVKALEDLDNVITKQNQYSVTALRLRAQYYFDQKAFTETVSDLNSVLEKEPRNSRALLQRGKAKANLGDTEGSLKDLSLAVEIHPGDKEANEALSRVFLLQGNEKDAIRQASAAIGKDPQAMDTWENRGDIYIKVSQYNKALKDYIRALRFSPSNPDLLIKLSTTYAFLDNLEQAAKVLNIAITQNPESANLIYRLAMLQLKQGDFGKAERNLRQASDLKYEVKKLFAEQFVSVANFEQAHSVRLPRSLGLLLSDRSENYSNLAISGEWNN